MPTNPPENTPRITPYLLYEDVAGAIGWLTTAFDFRESMRLPGPDGRIAHAEMRLADGLIMMGCPGPQYQNPKRLGQVTQHLYVYVDDVDAHFARARKTGAKIVEEPKDQFIESEHIEAFARIVGWPFTPDMPRRNIVTRDVRLNDLCGKCFRVGGATVEGIELCEPCSLFAKRTGREVLTYFRNCGGLRAKIIAGGEIQVGDAVIAID